MSEIFSGISPILESCNDLKSTTYGITELLSNLKSGDDDKMFDMFIAQERRIQFSKRRLSFLQAMIRGNELENQNHWRRMARSVV